MIRIHELSNVQGSHDRSALGPDFSIGGRSAQIFFARQRGMVITGNSSVQKWWNSWWKRPHETMKP